MKKIALLVLMAGVILFGKPPSVSAAVIFQDGFENGTGNWELKNGNSSISSGTGHSGNQSLRISYDTAFTNRYATHLFPQPVSNRAAAWIYDDLVSIPNGIYAYLSVCDSAYTKGLSIGIRPATSQTNYVYCPTENLNGCMDTGMPRTKGWHQFKIFVTPKGAYGKIDSQAFSYLPANSVNPAVNVGFTQYQRVNLGIIGNVGTGNVFFDDVYIDEFPLPPSNEEIANNQLSLFLQTYPVIEVPNINSMIKARETDFCSVDTQPCPDGSGKRPHWYYNEQLFHVYGALLSTAGVHGVNYLKSHQTASLQKAIEIITYIDGEFNRWKKNKSGSSIGNSLTTMSWIIWPYLPPNLQQSIRSHMLAEGEYFKDTFRPYSEYMGNSSGEENNWPGLYLISLSLAFKDMPQAVGWTERAKFFAFHSLTKNESYGGFTSRTIYDDNFFDNHDYHPHPEYGMGTTATMAIMEYLSKKVSGTAPTEFSHNVLPVWQKMKEFVDFRNFSYKGNKIVRRGRDLNPIDGIPDYTPQDNAFILSGQSDWGDDALVPMQFKVMQEVYGDNSVSDPETGFSTTDLYTHSMQFLYYTHSGYVWKYAPANTQLTEMLIDQDHSSPSYIWWRNSQWAWSYAYLSVLFDPNFTFPSTAPNPVCIPNCTNKACGNDGCGNSCGSCDVGQSCINYQCVVPTLTPTRTPTPVPPTPTRTPTPTPIPGDISGPNGKPDGKVDIQDYNQLVTDFGKTGTPGWIAADINKDGKVDIFDYNVLVGNFGK